MLLAAPAYAACSLVTLLALTLYLVILANVGRMRGRHRIAAPSTIGHPEFERAFRTQQNTLEQLIVFIPALWLFALYLSPLWAASLGLGWLLARLWYACGYCREGGRHLPGFVVSFLICIVLLLGGFAGILQMLIS